MTDKARILIVEDSASDAFMIKRMLSESLSFICYDFTTAPRISDALDLLDKEEFAAVLLDLNLLDSTGTATVSALHSTHPGLPIVVYTGNDDEALKERVIMCGATHYAVKGREGGFVIKFIIENVIAA